MLISYTSPPLDLPVSDRVFQNTIIKQRARPGLLQIEELPDGSCQVRQWVVVSSYADRAGAYGDPLPESVVAPRKIALLADNYTAVDAAPDTVGRLRYLLINEPVAPNALSGTGSPGAVRNLLTGQTEEIPEGHTWLSFLDAQPEPFMLQGFAFAAMQDQQDVRMRELKEQHIRQADAMGRFA